MQQSYLSNYDPRPFAEGLALAARQQEQANQARQRAAEQQAESDRQKQAYDLQRRNEAAKLSMQWSHEAEQTKAQAPIEFRKNFLDKAEAVWSNAAAERRKTNNAILFADEGTYDPESIAAARESNAQLDTQEKAIAAGRPVDLTKPIDVSAPYIPQLPDPVIAKPGPTVLAKQEADAKKADLTQQNLELGLQQKKVGIQKSRMEMGRIGLLNQKTRQSMSTNGFNPKQADKAINAAVGDYNAFLNVAPRYKTAAPLSSKLINQFGVRGGDVVLPEHRSWAQANHALTSTLPQEPEAAKRAAERFGLHAPAMISAITNPALAPSFTDYTKGLLAKHPTAAYSPYGFHEMMQSAQSDAAKGVPEAQVLVRQFSQPVSTDEPETSVGGDAGEEDSE